MLDEDDPDYETKKADLIAQRYAVSEGKLALIQTRIEKVNEELAKDPTNQYWLDYLDELNEDLYTAEENSKDLADSLEEMEKTAIQNAEELIKNAITNKLDEVEDAYQKEVDAAQKAADKVKEANDIKRQALEDYLDALEDIWAAEDEENEKQKKLKERSELVSDRNKQLTAGSSGDLQAMSDAQDTQDKIDDIDEELTEDAVEAWREKIRNSIQNAIDQLDKVDEELENQTKKLQEQLDNFQDFRKEIEDNNEVMYDLIQSYLNGENASYGGFEFGELSDLLERYAKDQGDYYSATYDPNANLNTIAKAQSYRDENGNLKDTKKMAESATAKVTYTEDRTFRDWMKALGYEVSEYNKENQKATVTKDGQSYTLDLSKLAGDLAGQGNYHYASAEEMKQLFEDVGLTYTLEDLSMSLINFDEDLQGLATTVTKVNEAEQEKIGLRETLEKSGYEVGYDNTTKQVTATKDGKTTSLDTSSLVNENGSLVGTQADISNLLSNANLSAAAMSIAAEKVELKSSATEEPEKQAASVSDTVTQNVEVTIEGTTINIAGSVDQATLNAIKNYVDSDHSKIKTEIYNELSKGTGYNGNKRKL
jgi:predicted heme/steroid binding protein